MLDNNTALTFAENDGVPTDTGSESQVSDNNTALTFVEGGSAVAEYVDGSNSFSVVNELYSDGISQSSTVVKLYSDGSNALSMTNTIYQDGSNALSMTNKIYQDGSNALSMTNTIYSDTNISYDVSIEHFEDGMVGSAIIPLRVEWYQDNLQSNYDIGIQHYQEGNGSFSLAQKIYEPISVKVDVQPVIYSDGYVNVNTNQKLYQDVSRVNDVGVYYYEEENGSFSLSQEIYKAESLTVGGKLVIYSDGSVNVNTNQKIYQDGITDFDMSLIAYTVDMSIISTVELKATVELYELLKGGLDVTAENQNFTMYQGDTKYIDFPIENNLMGSTAKWVLKKKVSDVVDIALKSTANGITMEDGFIRVKLEPVDTQGVKGSFYHELELTDSLGNVSTIATGYITIKLSGV